MVGERASVVVRSACVDDADAIGRIHVVSWQVAYIDALPKRGASALVSGVEQPAEVLVAVGFRPEDRVCLVDQQDGRVGGDRPVYRGRAGVDCDQGVVAGRFHEVEQPGLATSAFGGANRVRRGLDQVYFSKFLDLVEKVVRLETTSHLPTLQAVAGR